MSSSHQTAGSDQRSSGFRIDQPVVAIIAVCLLLFVDVPLPIFENSSRLLAILIFPLLLFGRGGVRTPFCAIMYVLLPFYVLVPIAFRPDIATSSAFDIAKVLIVQLLFLGGMVLLARVIASDEHRRVLTDMLVLFALASAVVASLQRFGVLGPLGRNRWGYSTTVSGALRGAGLLADPNFLAVLLASVVPLVVSWRFAWLRVPTLLVLALGLYSTNSRAGMLLAVVALAVSIASRVSTADGNITAKGRTSITFVAICMIGLFAFNVGGERDRVVAALLIEAGIQNGFTAGSGLDTFVAHERRQLLESWFNLGMQNLPFGVGMGTKNEATNAAHNTFASLFGEGGIIGLVIILTIAACLVYFIRRWSEPFAIMGLVIVLGGMVLSYSGMVFLILPMGLADGIMAARAERRETKPDISQSGRHPLPAQHQISPAGLDRQVPI